MPEEVVEDEAMEDLVDFEVENLGDLELGEILLAQLENVGGIWDNSEWDQATRDWDGYKSKWANRRANRSRAQVSDAKDSVGRRGRRGDRNQRSRDDSEDEQSNNSRRDRRNRRDKSEDKESDDKSDRWNHWRNNSRDEEGAWTETEVATFADKILCDLEGLNISDPKVAEFVKKWSDELLAKFDFNREEKDHNEHKSEPDEDKKWDDDLEWDDDEDAKDVDLPARRRL